VPVTDQTESTPADVERAKGSARYPAGTSAAAKKVAGARRNPSVVGYEDVTAPRWLRSAAGWSWRLIVVVLAISLVFFATSRVLLLFVAVFLALVFSAVLRPVVNVMSRVMPRGLATPLAMILSFAIFAGLLTYVGFSVAGQWETLGTRFNDGIGTLLDLLKTSPLHLTITSQDVQDWLASGQQWVSDNSGVIASQAWASAGSVGEVFATFALATFFTVFFLLRGTEMWEWFLNQLPTRSRESWFLGGGAAWYTFSGYTRGTFIVAASDGLLAMIILLILGVPLAAPLAVLVFIGAFIPLVGAPLAMVIAMVVALAANGPVNAILVGAGIALIGQFEGHVLQPIVMGRQVSLHPVVIALGVTAGTLVAGILGAVIAVPLIGVAWSVFSLLRHKDPPTDFTRFDDELEAGEELMSEGDGELPEGNPS
jgi:predicted PurR-regulated permease PerM